MLPLFVIDSTVAMWLIGLLFAGLATAGTLVWRVAGSVKSNERDVASARSEAAAATASARLANDRAANLERFQSSTEKQIDSLCDRVDEIRDLLQETLRDLRR